MGFLIEAIDICLAAAGIIKRRKNTVCHFNEEISKEEFHVMVKRSGRGIRRVTGLYAKETMVYGTVRSQSGILYWCFIIDFNDYGKLTGRYWIIIDNHDSDISKIVAERIALQIRDFPSCVDDSFNEELYREKVQEGLREEAGAYCPYCGKKNNNKDAKSCIHCGMRFRV